MAKIGFRKTVLWLFEKNVREKLGYPLLFSRVTPQLYLSGQYPKRAWTALQKEGISVVVSVRGEFDDRNYGIEIPHYLHFDVFDYQPLTLEQLQQGVSFLTQHLQAGKKAYIHCGAGRGRSAALVAAYLVSTGIDVSSAWGKIYAARPFIDPTEGQFECVQAFAQHLEIGS